MEKIPKGTAEYFLIQKEYEATIYNITREKTYDTNKFIGGLPITLEKKDVFTLVSKDLSNNYRYSVTQKVDGTRFLLFANYKKSNGERNIVLIDRNNDFYIPNNFQKNELPTFNGPKLIIDGELIAFDDNDKLIDPFDKYYNIKFFSFMAFDILYGPMTIEYSGLPNQKRLIIGNEVSMAGPIGGKMWPYKKRYDILYLLLMPSQINDNRPPLSMAFKNIKWFVVEIKPIYYISALKVKEELYNNNDNKAYFQKNLIKFRNTYYNAINEIVKKELPKIELINIKLDGLIFTPFDTEYVLSGPWKKFLNVQYKWKPSEQQTIDFAIVSTEKNSTITTNSKNSDFLLKVSKGNTIDTFMTKNVLTNEYIPAQFSNTSMQKIFQEKNTINRKYKSKELVIGEFLYDIQRREYVLDRFRFDKDKPNAISTAINVMNAIRNPVDINIIKNFLRISVDQNINTEKIIKLLKYMTKSQLLRCSIYNRKISMLDETIKQNIIAHIDKLKSNNSYEYEIRFGTIEPNKFQTNLSFNFYKQFMSIISLFTSLAVTNVSYNVYHDYYKDFYEDGSDKKIRTRYLYLKELNNFVKIATIDKTTINNLNVDIKYLYNIDLRFSLSEEKIIKEKNVEKENVDLILEKKRYSFGFDIFSIDFTEISKYYEDGIYKKDKAPKFQIEIELNNNKIKKYSSAQIYEKIYNTLNKVLNMINS